MLLARIFKYNFFALLVLFNFQLSVMANVVCMCITTPVTFLKVVDGDTVHVFYKDEVYKIRLTEIDAPERDQPYGSNTTEYLKTDLLLMIFFSYKTFVSLFKDIPFLITNVVLSIEFVFSVEKNKKIKNPITNKLDRIVLVLLLISCSIRNAEINYIFGNFV